MNHHESVGGTRATRNAWRSSWLCLSWQSKDQQGHETKKCCRASSTSKPSPASVTVRWVLFLLPLNITGLGSAHATVSVDITLPIGQSLRKKSARSRSTPPEVFLVFCCKPQITDTRETSVLYRQLPLRSPPEAPILPPPPLALEWHSTLLLLSSKTACPWDLREKTSSRETMEKVKGKQRSGHRQLRVAIKLVLEQTDTH